LYLFDLSSSDSSPVQTIDLLASQHIHDKFNEENQNGDVKNQNKDIDVININFSKNVMSIYDQTQVLRHRQRPGIKSFEFNQKQRGFIAICDTDGNIHVWKLNSYFTHKTKQDDIILNELGNISNL
jgi:hypothetical protein